MKLGSLTSGGSAGACRDGGAGGIAGIEDEAAVLRGAPQAAARTRTAKRGARFTWRSPGTSTCRARCSATDRRGPGARRRGRGRGPPRGQEGTAGLGRRGGRELLVLLVE